MELTKEIAYKAITEFFSVDKPFVLFGTGTSCALDWKFGMPALEKHLRTELSSGLMNNQMQEWQKVVSALDAETHDFESAMDFITNDDLTSKVVETTAEFVASLDSSYAHKIINGDECWPAGALLKKIVDALPQSDSQLHVATPNYDLLAEYSFIESGIPYITGFYGGFCRYYDWTKAKRAVRLIKRKPLKNRVEPSVTEEKYILLYKPHGSLNTFEVAGRIVECDAWIANKPKDAGRVMITPGTAKYQHLHKDRTQLSEYDKAVSEHTRFLFLGFGFNDSQLVNNTFLQKLQKDKCPALIVTRDLNPRIEEMLGKCPNMWILCRQSENNTTRIFNTNYSEWLNIDDKELWHFDAFASEFLGG